MRRTLITIGLLIAGLFTTYIEAHPHHIADTLATLQQKKAPVTAFFYVNNDHDLEGMERQVRNLLAKNGFTLIEEIDAATCFIDLSTSLETDEVVSTGITNLNTCYCKVVLRVYNNATQELMLEYAPDDIKVLTPIEKSYKQTLAICIREVMKRMQRELPKQLRMIKMNN